MNGSFDINDSATIEDYAQISFAAHTLGVPVWNPNWQFLGSLGQPNGEVIGSIPSGYQLYKTIHDEETGLRVLLEKMGPNKELVVSFAGTEPAAIQDVYSDLTSLGASQWYPPAPDYVFEEIESYLNNNPTDPKVTFVGQSLGGALAQLAAYDFIEMRLKNSDPVPNTTVFTINSLGGEAGLQDLHSGSLDDSIVSQINGAHIWVEGDLVSSLGGAQIGGNTYRLSHPNSFDFLEAHYPHHSVNLLNYLTNPAGQYQLTPADPSFSGPLDEVLSTLQEVAGPLQNFLNFDGEVDQFEAAARSMTTIMQLGLFFGVWEPVALGTAISTFNDFLERLTGSSGGGALYEGIVNSWGNQDQ